MCVCVCVCVIQGKKCIYKSNISPHKNLCGGLWAGQVFTMPPTLSLSLCLSNSCIFSLRLSLFLSSCLSYFLSLPAPQQAGQMAAPRPALPEKACELKVIPSRFEELPALSRCGGRGALAHLPPRLRDIWLGFCGMMSTRPPAATATATPTGTGPKGEAVICSVFHQANEQMVYLLVCVDLCLCICLCV